MTKVGTTIGISFGKSDDDMCFFRGVFGYIIIHMN